MQEKELENVVCKMAPFCLGLSVLNPPPHKFHDFATMNNGPMGMQ